MFDILSSPTLTLCKVIYNNSLETCLRRRGRDYSCLMGFACVIPGADIKVFGNLAASEAIGSLMGLQKKNCKAVKCISLIFISWSVEFPLGNNKLGIKQASSPEMFTSS